MTINCSKECEDDTLKPLKIYVIRAVFFILLARKWNYKIFAVIMENIKKVLEPKQYVDSWLLIFKEYYNLINKFKK